MRDYGRDLFKHNQELTEEKERLREEIKELKKYKTHVAELENKLELLESSIEARIAKAVEEAVAKATAPLLAENAELKAKIKSQQEEILRLKAQLNKNSSNSSKPPSSNGFVKLPNNREASGKKQGGQEGHKGNRLNIPQNLDDLVEKGTALHIVVSKVPEGEPYVSDWVVDIKITPVYTEYRRAVGAPTKISYGNGIAVLAVYLSVVGLISYKRLSDFFAELTYGAVKVSKATIAKFNHGLAENIVLEPFINDLLNGKTINVDETPIKTTERLNDEGVLETSEKTTFNAYIRTYSNATTTILTAAPRKTKESVIADNILTRFHGIVAQDHEAKFYNFGDEHATCGAHLTRELNALETLCLIEWAAAARSFFLKMNSHKNEDVRKNKTFCEPILLCSYEAEYDALVAEGELIIASMSEKSFGRDELCRTVNRLKECKAYYMLFMRNYDAPFTNNLAERDLRHCKTKQKISGCFRSWQAVLDYCKIRSILGSAKKRSENSMDILFSYFSYICPAGQ